LIRLVRSLIGLAFLAGLVLCAFEVRLGRRTFAEHVDRIGETPEARELLDGTRAKVTPFVEDATDRMLGEYIEAPTQPVPERRATTPAGPRPARPPRTGTPRPTSAAATPARAAAVRPARPPTTAIAAPR